MTDPTPSPAAAPAAAPRPSFARRHWGKLTLLAVIGSPLVAITLWSLAAFQYTYSEGTRTGIVQKLSRKGWVC
ncbi:MAG: hypothetical protein K2X99_05920, partial [Gemmatimonadaceae bacterium]|nr:hypothetical protein [Gemmatimonadaceae bacterium]